MKHLKKLNRILLSSILGIGLALSAVYGWSYWENQRTISLGGPEVYSKSDNQPTVAIRDLMEKNRKSDSSEKTASILGQQDSGSIINYYKGNAGVSVLGNVGRDIFSKKESSSEKDEFSFVVIGDAENIKDKGYEPTLPVVLQSARKLNPTMAFFTGDLLLLESSNTLANTMRIEQIKELIQTNFSQYHVVLGNHDLECGQECLTLWNEKFFDKNLEQGKVLYHSFDYANTHFVLLDNVLPEKGNVDLVQLAWLEQDLAATTKTHKIVFTHVPVTEFFKSSTQDCQNMSCNSLTRERLVGILQKHHVDLVVAGHEHAFDHKIEGGIDYVLSGNSGTQYRHEGTFRGNNYSYFSVSGNKISLKAMSTDGKTLREINIKD